MLQGISMSGEQKNKKSDALVINKGNKMKLRTFVTSIGMLLLVTLTTQVNAHGAKHFPQVAIDVKGIKLQVDLAKTPEARAHGLQHKKYMCDDCGMLFEFEYARVVSFWMKNTRIPLSIAYIDDSKKIISLQDMEPESAMLLDYRLQRYESPKAVRYALELEKGRFEKLGVELGDKFEKFYP